MSIVKKRKRGRPRVHETHGADNIDMMLIEEYRKRTAFYDRSHPQYSKREFLDPLWREMAQVLGQNVNVVKTRILQLRNRYNLEKRRVESLQARYDDPQITSQWAMYKELSFLHDHIKSRGYYANSRINLRDIKMSPLDYTGSEVNSEEEQINLSTAGLGARTQHNHRINIPLQMKTRNSAPFNGIKRIRTDRAIAANSTQPPGSVSDLCNGRITNGLDSSGITVSGNRSVANAVVSNGNRTECTASAVSTPGNKFDAIGQFLAASLLEMDERDALRLVDKFTSEIVHALISDLKSSTQNKDTSLS